MGKAPNSLSISVSNFETKGDGKMYVFVYVNKDCVYKGKDKEEKLNVQVTGGCKDNPKVKVKVVESSFGPNKTRGEWEFSGEEVAANRVKGVKTTPDGAKATFNIQYKAGEETKEFSSTSDSG